MDALLRGGIILRRSDSWPSCFANFPPRYPAMPSLSSPRSPFDLSAALDPLGLFRLPLGGDVWQRIATGWFSPSTTVNNTYNGDPAIEERVTREVASYGRQLGWLSEIVLAMAKEEALPKDAVQKLTEAVARIDKIKKEARDAAVGDARQALSKLASSSPDAFRALVNETYRAMNRRKDEHR